jgi:hypothetical protein
MHRRGALDRRMSGLPLDGWLPIGVSWRDAQPEIEWCLAGSAPLGEPFFEESVRRLVSRPFNRVFRRRTSGAELVDWAAQRPGLTPNGFIFHMSRCGSTLVAQMLAARGDSVVLSEPAPVDAMLRPPEPIPEGKHTQWLRALISAMALSRTGNEQYCFIKFDCWHVLFLPLIRRVFPTVPWVFLYREPRRVLASHLRQRGVQTVPGLVDSRLFGIEPVASVTMPAAEYCARVLGTICEAAGRESGGVMVNYNQLPDALFDTILPRFAVPVSLEARHAMQEAALRSSKHPGIAFSAAGDAAPVPSGRIAEAAVAAFLDGPYEALEQRRLTT